MLRRDKLSLKIKHSGLLLENQPLGGSFSINFRFPASPSLPAEAAVAPCCISNSQLCWFVIDIDYRHSNVYHWLSIIHPSPPTINSIVLISNLINRATVWLLHKMASWTLFLWWNCLSRSCCFTARFIFLIILSPFLLEKNYVRIFNDGSPDIVNNTDMRSGWSKFQQQFDYISILWSTSYSL